VAASSSSLVDFFFGALDDSPSSSVYLSTFLWCFLFFLCFFLAFLPSDSSKSILIYC
jgi:hypothetical protein